MTDNPRRSVRSIDVARLAGVSRSAVSRAFTKDAYVSDETKRKVLEAANLLGYQPNAIARSLISRRSNIVGVVVSELSNPFYALVLESLSLQLQNAELASLLICSRDAREIDASIPRLLAYQVDGVIIAAAPLSSTSAAQCSSAGIPVILINRYVEYDDVSAVFSDNLAGGRAVADHLVNGGHTRIAFMAGLENTSSSRDRESGFVSRLTEHRMFLYAREVGNYKYQDGVIAARRLLSLDPKPDAIFCANDVMAIAAMDVARREFGLGIPKDLSIAGYDNVQAASSAGYDLTTVDQNIDLMAKDAVSMLLRHIAAPPPRAARRLVPSRLVERGSTRRPPGAS